MQMHVVACNICNNNETHKIEVGMGDNVNIVRHRSSCYWGGETKV